ncbi:hypothetical protein niasHS_017960 [Heterodera schachtii]|uniref:Uncharacterized protein n=1 Tax=Heterodera schachtii TaxID=97005 RepID=A0ABD2I6B9_HETSC
MFHLRFVVFLLLVIVGLFVGPNFVSADWDKKVATWDDKKVNKGWEEAEAPLNIRARRAGWDERILGGRE